MAERIPLIEVTSNPKFLLLKTCCLKITKKQRKKRNKGRRKNQKKKTTQKKDKKKKKNITRGLYDVLHAATHDEQWTVKSMNPKRREESGTHEPKRHEIVDIH
jgi:hypothetical protein